MLCWPGSPSLRPAAPVLGARITPAATGATTAGITTLPIWIYQNLFRPNQAPIVNVVAAALVLISILPIYIAQRFSNTDERGGGLI